MKELFEKYLSDTATQEERELLLRHVRDDEQLNGWLRSDIEYTESGMPAPIRDRILRNVYSPVSHSENRRHRHAVCRLWRRAAAVTVILMLTAALCWSLFSGQKSEPSNIPSGDIVVSTNLGEHSSVILPDGTSVMLNALSTVRYSTAMPDGTRHVTVEGEAFFNVAKDEHHPFVVTADEVSVTCLGTAFDVRNYADENNISVVLAEGRVRVGASEADLTMEPESRVVFDRQTHTLSKHSVPSSNYTCWMSGEVRYNNQTLETIAAELSRNYHISMVLTSDRLREERFTGYLGRASLRNVLDVLCLAADMNYYIDNDTVVYVYERKQ